MKKWIIGLCALAATTGMAQAQENAAIEAAAECVSGIGDELTRDGCITADDLLGQLDLTVPENSLFTLMNSTPDTVIRPKVGDRFSLAVLPEIANTFGSDQYAVGIEINPGLLMAPERFTIAELMGQANAWDGDDSNARRLRRSSFWSQFTISGAAIRTTGDEATVSRYGIGLNYNYDSGSPLWAHAQGLYGNCIREMFSVNPVGEILDATAQAAREVVRERQNIAADTLLTREQLRRLTLQAERLLVSDPTFAAAVEEKKDELIANEARFAVYRREAEQAIDGCVRAAAPWNREVYGAGIATYLSETDAEDGATSAEDGEETGFGAWATWAYPVREHGQIVVTGRYVDNGVRTRTDGANEVTEVYDGWTFGARYIHSFGGEDRRAIRGFVEAAYSHEEFGAVDDEFTQAGIGVEIQLRDNIFLQVLVGDTFGSDIDRSSYLSGQIKWSFSEGPAR